MKYDYSFTEEEARAAYEEWGCNCGPSSLAFALQVGLDKVRGKIPGFDVGHYTSPTMMRAALLNLGRKFEEMPLSVARETPAIGMFHLEISLVRVQWSGPWTQPNVNPKWKYMMTHWIAAWGIQQEGKPIAGMKVTSVGLFVFDCNGGIRSFREWEKEIVPAIIANYPRADGAWFPTHVWRLVP